MNEVVLYVGTVNEIVPMATSSCSTPDGRVLLEGETMTLGRCSLCLCHNGGMLCQVESCPPILCHHPYYQHDDSCCPVCPAGAFAIRKVLPRMPRRCVRHTKSVVQSPRRCVRHTKSVVQSCTTVKVLSRLPRRCVRHTTTAAVQSAQPVRLS